MTEESLNRGLVLRDEIKVLKYVLEAMEQQPDLCVHFHKNLGEDISLKNEELVCDILRLIRTTKEDLEKEFEEL